MEVDHMKEQKNTKNQAKNKDSMNQFKHEVASELGVNLENGGENTSRENGRVGGEMVKRMIQKQESQMR